jgi:hypothetical protein
LSLCAYGNAKAISYQSADTTLRDEAGLEYLQQTDANDVDEANVLLESVLQPFRDHNMETLAKTSHDLKSVSGLIGMQETSALAAKIQDDCLSGEHAASRTPSRSCSRWRRTSRKRYAKSASTLPET